MSLALHQTHAHRDSYSLLTQFWVVGNSVLLSRSLCSEHSSHGHNRNGMPWIAKHQWIKHSQLTDTIFTAILRHSWQWILIMFGQPPHHASTELRETFQKCMNYAKTNKHSTSVVFPDFKLSENQLGIFSPLWLCAVIDSLLSMVLYNQYYM